MKIITVKFWCNAGYTEEEVEIEMDEGLTKYEEEYWLECEFNKWLNNNEQNGYEIIK